MSYLTQNEISTNGAMFGRVAQCAASEGVPDPNTWADVNRREWAASPGWDTAWESARASHGGNPSYDPGSDEAVITDGQILAAVQGMQS